MATTFNPVAAFQTGRSNARTIQKQEQSIDRERAGLLVVERAETAPASADLFELGVFGDELDDVGRLPNTFYVLINDPHLPDATTRPRRLFEWSFAR